MNNICCHIKALKKNCLNPTGARGPDRKRQEFPPTPPENHGIQFPWMTSIPERAHTTRKRQPSCSTPGKRARGLDNTLHLKRPATSHRVDRGEKTQNLRMVPKTEFPTTSKGKAWGLPGLTAQVHEHTGGDSVLLLRQMYLTSLAMGAGTGACRASLRIAYARAVVAYVGIA